MPSKFYPTGKRDFETIIESLPILAQKQISTVSMDLWEPYRQAVKAVLSQAEIVADPFHVMKNLTDLLQKARRAIQKHLPKEVTGQIKGLRWILVKNSKDLKSDEMEKLQQVYQLSPKLRQLHQLKEKFHQIFETVTD